MSAVIVRVRSVDEYWKAMCDVEYTATSLEWLNDVLMNVPLKSLELHGNNLTDDDVVVFSKID